MLCAGVIIENVSVYLFSCGSFSWMNLWTTPDGESLDGASQPDEGRTRASRAFVAPRCRHPAPSRTIKGRRVRFSRAGPQQAAVQYGNGNGVAPDDRRQRHSAWFPL